MTSANNLSHAQEFPRELELAVPRMRDLLRCPACKAALVTTAEKFVCSRNACGACFPVIKGVPVLLNEQASVFSVPRTPTPPARSSGFARLRAGVEKLLPDTTHNLKADQNYSRLAQLLDSATLPCNSPTLLVVGGKKRGEGMDRLLKAMPGLVLIQSDVAFGPETELICDAHDLPFGDASLDGIIIQAVLEHVLDPYRCVEEIYRVLKPEGVVYAETPFMQQVHLGRYDFTRFTHLGHRRLFRRFEEIASGPCVGPGTVLAWSWRYFLSGLSRNRVLSALLEAFARLSAWPVVQLDRWLIDRPISYDAASAYYFLGRKSDRTLSDRELLALYKGEQ